MNKRKAIDQITGRTAQGGERLRGPRCKNLIAIYDVHEPTVDGHSFSGNVGNFRLFISHRICASSPFARRQGYLANASQIANFLVELLDPASRFRISQLPFAFGSLCLLLGQGHGRFRCSFLSQRLHVSLLFEAVIPDVPSYGCHQQCSKRGHKQQGSVHGAKRWGPFNIHENTS
jgi:hypothetical protein